MDIRRELKAIAAAGAMVALGVTPSSAPRAQVNTLCAVVKLEINQQAALEREAFTAHLAISNNSQANPLTNLQVQVFVTDNQGNAADGLFFVKVATLTGTTALDGTGVIQSSATADAYWLIIPSTGAGGSLPAGLRYGVKAVINSQSNGSPQNVTTFPAYITVNPQPLVKLEYALPYEVFGQEPLLLPNTITPVQPYPLAVRVTNVGYGTANNFQIQSAQPQIVDNKLSLPVDFKILGTQVAGQTIPNTLLIPFGNVPPNGVSQASWIMSSSLSGRFVGFSSTFTHAADLGGQLTSLLQSVTTYTLIKDVLVDLPGRDAIPDYLVNETMDRGAMQAVLDAGNQPPAQAVLESDQPLPLIVTEVPGAVSGTLSGSNAALAFALNAAVSTNVWVHASAPFPYGGSVTLTSAHRADGKVINPRNVWISKHFNKSTLTYSYWVNLFDLTAAVQSYVLQFDPSTLVVPPAPVTDLAAATAAGPGGLSLNWTATGDGNNGYLFGGTYLFQAETSSAAVFAPGNAELRFTTNTAPGVPQSTSFTGLIGNATYYAHLWTENGGGGVSALSNAATAYTLPNPPAGLAALFVGASSAAMTWQIGNNALPVVYQLSASTGSGGVALSSTPFFDSFTSSFVFTGLTPDTSVQFFGDAVNPVTGVAGPQAVLGGTVTAPAVPAPLAFSGVSTGSLVANWSPAGNPPSTSYSVELATTPAFDVLAASSPFGPGASFAFTGLTPGAYYARVRARGRAGALTAYAALGSVRAASPGFNCGDSLTAGVAMGADLSCPAGAVTLNAPGALLDCQGHTLAFGAGSVGVAFANAAGAAVRNCVLRGDGGTFVGAPAAAVKLTSITFASSSGTAAFFPLVALPAGSSVTATALQLGANRVYLSTAAAPFLNAPARLTLTGLTAAVAVPTVDPSDSGAFTPCAPPLCSAVAYAGGRLNFSVAHFTTYSSTSSTLATTLTVGDPSYDSGAVYATNASALSLTAASSGGTVLQTYLAADTTAYSVYAGSFTFAAEGPHTLSFYSVDSIGDVETPTKVVLDVDLTAPITTLLVQGSTVPAANALTVSSTTPLALSANDPVSKGVASGVSATFYAVDVDPFDPACDAVPPDPTAPAGTCANETYGGAFTLTPGTHRVYYFSEDNVLNQEVEHIATFTVTSMITWTGSAGDGLWRTAANWSGGQVPSSFNDVVLDMNATADASGSAISFRSLVLGDDAGSNTARLTISSETASNASITIDKNASLTVVGLNQIALGSLTIRSGGTLTHAPNTASFVNELNLIVTGSMTVENGALIGIAGMGYPAGAANTAGSGPGGGRGFNGCGGAASHAVYGGNSCNGATAGAIYDDWTNPTMPGSGGAGETFDVGGDGGGVLLLNVGTLTLNGVIDASGVNIRGVSGGGAGGTINITASNLAGSGAMKARGGPGGDQEGGGAGGAVKILSLISDLSNLTFDVAGGSQKSATPCCGSQSGAAGTVYLRRPGETNFSLYVGGPGLVNKPQAITPFSVPLLVDNLNIANAVIQSTTGVLQPITAISSMALSGAYNLTVTTLSFPTVGLTSFNMPVGAAINATSMSFDPSWTWTAAALNLPNLTAAQMTFVSGTVGISTLTITGNAPLTILSGATLAPGQLNVPANTDLLISGTLTAPNASFSPNNISLNGANVTLAGLGVTTPLTLPSNASLSVATFTGTNLTLAGTMRAGVIALTGDLTMNTGSVLSALAPQTQGLALYANNMTVAANASINLSAAGFLGGAANLSGSGPGGGVRANGCGGAASHAAFGGNSCNGAPTGAIYDDWTNPTIPGSGGGGGTFDAGGNGGGALILNVSTLTLNGIIDVSGGNAVSFGGGGSGGAINISAANLLGSGSLRARGGNGGAQEGGGSGGAIKIVSLVSDLSNWAFDLSGGSQGAPNPCCGSQSGAGGTAYIRRPGETNFNLYVGGSGTVFAPQAITPLSLPLIVDTFTIANAEFVSTTTLQPLTISSSMTVLGASIVDVSTLTLPSPGLSGLTIPSGAIVNASQVFARAISTTNIAGSPELVYIAPTGNSAVLVPTTSSSGTIALAAAQGRGLVPISQFYDLSPEKVAFTPNAVITFTFDPTVLASLGVSTATLGIYDYSIAQSTWIPLGGVISSSGNSITANVAMLSSIVAILGRKNDTTPPVTTISFSTPSFGPSNAPVAISTISAVTLAAVDLSSGSSTASGVASTYYAVDVATPTFVYTKPFNLAAGLHTVFFHSVDVAGNVEATSSVTVNVYSGPFVGTVFPSSGPIGVNANFVGFNLGAYNGIKDKVYFGASSATVLSWNGTTVTASVPTLAAGPYALSITALQSGATVAVQAGTFTVLTPQLFDVLPDSGPIGAAVVLDGSGFGAFSGAVRSQVLFGGTTAPVTTWNDAQVHATVPGVLGAGDYPVTVRRIAIDGGTVQSSSQNFHVDSMTLGSVNPSTGPIGVTFALYGAGFGGYNGSNTKILFGGTTAQVTSWLDTKVTGLAPALATGTYNVSLLRLQGNGMAFSNVSSFTVTALILSTPAPAAVPMGAVFTLSGSGFGPAGGANTRLNIGGGTIPYTSWNDTTIMGRVPTLAAGPQPVWIERLYNGGVESSNTTYLQVEAPAIAAVTPSSAPIGAPVVISGAGFGLLNGTSTSVLIAGTTAPVTLWNDTTVQFTVPGDASTGTTTVQLKRVAPDGGISLSNAVAFIVENITLAAVSPSSGPVGTVYTITGSGFGPYNGVNTQVLIGGATTSISVWNDTTIKGTVPALAAGAYGVAVQRQQGGTIETSSASSFTVTAPQVFSLTPSSAPIGTPFTVTGVSFGAYAGALNTQILFNGTTAMLTLWNDTTIKGYVPGAIAVGSATVVVQRNAPGGSVQAPAPGFLVLQPIISTITPNYGLAGRIVDIYGSNFGPAAGNATHLYVGSSTVPFSIWNDAHIRWTVPAGLANGLYQVTVMRSPGGGTVASNAVNFTVGAIALGAFGLNQATLALAQLPDAYFQGDVNIPFDQGGRIETPAHAAVTIPANALPVDVEMTLNRDKTSFSSARTAAQTSTQLGAAGEAISFGPEGTQFLAPVTLELPYDPALVPAGLLSSLQVYYYDPAAQKWTALASTVDTTRHVVSAQTTHFSLYQPLGQGIGVTAADASFGLKAAYAFPNPVHSGAVTIRIQPGQADSVSVRVYDLSGRKIHDSSNFTLNPALDDGNGLGAQYTYDHAWDVSGIGSGVYTYVITAKKAGQSDIHKTGKIGVAK